jgi:hypothetical protein
MHDKYQELLCRIQDKRARKVVFLSHCFLNENTRYPGGAYRGGCITEILTQCVEQDLGMVQMPCPEQIACGVKKTLDFKKSFEVLANIDIHTVTSTDANRVVLVCLINGKGLFIQSLQRKRKPRKMDIRFLGHLIAEMYGNSSNVIL